MSDISAEPSMEEILSSIKRIIAEEDSPAARRRAARPAPPPPEPGPGGDEVLELSDPMPPANAGPPVEREAEPEPGFAPTDAPGTARATQAAAPAEVEPDPSASADPILSSHAADATRGALASLSRAIVRPEPHSGGTLEEAVREMLRPMLKNWLDANLPAMVEKMVAQEIARISGREG